MHLIIDGYNLLHVGRSLVNVAPEDLERYRDRLIDQLASYRRTKPCDITVVFDGWLRGWVTEQKERKRGIELIFSKVGEKADEVIKRMVREEGSRAVVVTSDREICHFAERLAVAVVPSDQFKNKMELGMSKTEKENVWEEREAGLRMKKKGPSRRLSKKERRFRTALKKL